MIVIAFFIGLLTDLVWTRCIKSVAEKNAFWSANWSIAIYACGIFSTTLIVEKDIYGIIAYLVGGYLGTFIGVKYGGLTALPSENKLLSEYTERID